MKRSLFVIAAGCVFVAGCNEKVELAPEVLGEGVYATLEQPDVLSTKSLDYADGKLSFSWANGDQLMVYGQSTSAILTVNEAEGTVANVTKLESPDFKLNEGSTYYVFSPIAGTLSESTKDAVNVSFDNQRQVSNGSTAHLKSNQYACATATVENNSVNFQLYNQVSWVRFSHKFDKDVKASKVVFSVEGTDDAFVHDGTLNTTSPVTDKGFTTSITADNSSQYFDINLGEESSEGIDVASGTALDVFVTLHPVDLTGKTLKVQVLDKSGNVLSTNEYAGRAIKRNAFVSFTDTSVTPGDVASVNGVGYAELYEALWACKNGETVKLLKDVEVGGLELYSENNAVLDLNGKNLITTGEPGFMLRGATLTIKGSGVVGDTTQTKTDHLFDLVMGSTLTVEGDAEFYAQTDCIYAGIAGVNDTYINVKGGKWYAKESNGVYWTINKEDGKKNWIYISVTGGEFYKFNPAESHTENPVENWVADGYGVVKDGDWYKVGTDEQISEIIASNTTNLTNELSSGTATVSGDVTVNCVIAGANSTLELVDGAIITTKGPSSGPARDGIMCSKNMSIQGNGTIVADISKDATRGTAIRVGGGTLDIYDGVSIEAGSGNSANYAIRIVKGTVNIHGGYFHTSNTGVCELIYLESGYPSSNKATLNISGGVFECDGDPKFMINCQDSYIKKCTISITGGTFVGWNPADSEADKINGANANWVADGYVSTKTTYNGKDAWVVTKK